MTKELTQASSATSDDMSHILLAGLANWKLLPYKHLSIPLVKGMKNYLDKVSETPQLFYSKFPLWVGGVKKLGWDSDFFGFGVGRIEPLVCSAGATLPDAITYGDTVIAQCVAHATELGLLQLSAPVHCSDTIAHLCLERAGFRLMDTIITYDLKQFDLVGADDDPCVRKAEITDMDALAKISGECFANRHYNVNRFNSDPQFPTEKVRELYSLWLENSFKTGLADIIFTYVTDGQPVGFVTASLPTEDDISVGVKIGRIPLNAVHPNYQAKGIYTKLATAAINWLRAQGAEVVEIKTQLPNIGVHRTWSRLGAHNTCSSHTFHLNLND